MKKFLLAIAFLAFSSSGFARPQPFSCWSEGKPLTKITSTKMCVKGKTFKLNTDGNKKFNKAVYCFNNNFTGLGCSTYTKKHKKNDPVTHAKGSWIDGDWYPACTSVAANPDGDKWGWENEESCVYL